MRTTRPPSTTRPTVAQPALLLRAGQVATWLGVTPQTVAGWARDGTLPFHRDDGRWRRFVAAEVADAVAKMGRRVPPLPAALRPRARPGASLPPPTSGTIALALPATATVPVAPAADVPDPARRHANHTPTASLQLGGFLQLQRLGSACDPATAELFFDQSHERGHQTRDRQAAAKAICGLCPILDRCRQVARADPSLDGIWGGETAQERRAARRDVQVGAAGNPGGRLLAQQAYQQAQRAGLPAAAARLGVPAATLRRVLALYGLVDDQAVPAAPLAAVAAGKACRG